MRNTCGRKPKNITGTLLIQYWNCTISINEVTYPIQVETRIITSLFTPIKPVIKRPNNLSELVFKDLENLDPIVLDQSETKNLISEQVIIIIVILSITIISYLVIKRKFQKRKMSPAMVQYYPVSPTAPVCLPWEVKS